MKQGIKKALVMLLSVAMVFTFMAMPVYADGASIDDVRAAIQALSADAHDYTAADRTRIESIYSDFQALSDEDQAILDSEASHTGTGQPLGRVLESALWTVWSFDEADDSTTLADGVYDSTTTPALASEYSKGKSTSARQKAWSVKEVQVADGKATATITVESDSYTGIMLHGKVYPQTNTSGNSEFAGVPIDLNSTFYFNGVSSAMPTPIAFSLTTTITEPIVEEDADYTAVEAALAKVPADLSIYTDETAAAVTDAANAVVYGKKASEQAEVDAMAAAIEAAVAALVEKEPVTPGELEDGAYSLPELKAGPSSMFNHFVKDSGYLIVNGDKATVRFITDGSTASIQKYTKIALGKSSELVETSYQSELPEGTTIIEGQLQPYDEGTGMAKYLFEVEITKEEAEALLNNSVEDDIYIVVYNKEGSSEEKKPGWYKPSKDIYLSLGALGTKTEVPTASEAFGFTLQVGQYTEGADFHTASLEGVTYALKDTEGNEYEPSYTTTSMLTYSNLSADNTYTFTATKEEWTVVKQGEWNVEAHAYEYIYLDTDEINVTLTKDDAGKNITDSTNPGMIFRVKPRDPNAVDEALAQVPEDLTIFTEDTAAKLNTAVEAADPEEEDPETLQAMADAVISAIQGLVPLDGSYTAQFEHTGNGMFKIIDAVSLDVQDGKMDFHFINGSQTYIKLFIGTTDEANAAEESECILPGEAATASNGKAGYNWIVPVSALNTEIPLAAYSKSKSTFNSTGNFKVLASSLKKIGQEEKIVLEVNNTTGMFNVVSAYLVTENDQEYLVAALNGTGYKEMYKGTYEQAIANGDGSKDKGNDTWIHSYTNEEGKYEFKIPVNADETYVPLVAVSDSYYKKYLNGVNSLERAFYPRQFTLDREAKTLVTGDYEYTQALEVKNNVKMFSVSGAELQTVGGPNSNNYAAELVLTMGSTSFDKMYAGRIAEAEAAEKTIALSEDKTFTVPVKWVAEFGKPETLETLVGEPFIASFYSVKNKMWYERELTINEEEGTLVINDVFADYSAVDAALEKLPFDLSVYTEETAQKLRDVVNNIDRTKKSHEQAAVDAMAKDIEDAIDGLKMKSGWVKTVDGKWMYGDAEGNAATGWLKVSGKWYYMDKDGIMQTGWVKVSGKWYYFNTSGVMQTGWQKIGGKQYFFKSSGAMASKEWVKGYYWVNKDGSWTYKYKGSWQKTNGKWWFGDTSGWYAKNTTITIDGKSYTFDSKGYLK